MPVCKPSTLKQGDEEFKASLDSMARPCLTKKKKNKKIVEKREPLNSIREKVH